MDISAYVFGGACVQDKVHEISIQVAVLCDRVIACIYFNFDSLHLKYFYIWRMMHVHIWWICAGSMELLT